MKRILLVIEGLGSGGAERQICGLAVMLTNAGYVCRLITYVHNQFYEPYLRQNKVDYDFVPKLRNKTTRIFGMAKYVRNYRADVVISYLPSVNMAMCLAKFFFNAKLIVSERNNNVGISCKDRIRFNVYRMADAIIPNSQSQSDFINRNFSFLKTKIHTIINFVDVKRFTPKETFICNKELKIVTIARYAQQKNILKYLDVIAEVKKERIPVHFDWYGKIDKGNDYYVQVVNKIQYLDIGDYITLHDSCSDVEKVYHNADVFCLPSLYEGYPNVIAEAMSSGLPVICSNRYENPYIVRNKLNGFLFNPEVTEDILSAIRKVVALTPRERIEMGLLNRQICLERNTEEKFLQNYIKLIES